MDYKIIKDICRVNKIELKTIAAEIGLSPEGFKRAVEQGSLSARFILPLCRSLGITPNKLFGVGIEKQYISPTAINQTQIGGNNNKQEYNGADNKILLKLLKDKDAELTRANIRIDNLLKMLRDYMLGLDKNRPSA